MLYASTWLGLPFSVIVAGAVYVVFHFLLYHTRFGTYVFAIGGNSEALMLAGVPVKLLSRVDICSRRIDGRVWSAALDRPHEFGTPDSGYRHGVRRDRRGPWSEARVSSAATVGCREPFWEYSLSVY